MVHVDVKKLGRIPAGGGWRLHGLDRTRLHRHKTVKIGYEYVHTAIDDHTRLAYSEIHADEKDSTCAESCTARWPGSLPTASPSDGC